MIKGTPYWGFLFSLWASVSSTTQRNTERRTEIPSLLNSTVNYSCTICPLFTLLTFFTLLPYRFAILTLATPPFVNALNR